MASTTPDVLRKTTSRGCYILGGSLSNTGRGFVVSGVSGSAETVLADTPSAGAAIDGVSYNAHFDTGNTRLQGAPAFPGMPVQVEGGGSVSDGDDLEVDSDGRFVTASTGTVVARALEAGSFGSYFWAVFV